MPVAHACGLSRINAMSGMPGAYSPVRAAAVLLLSFCIASCVSLYTEDSKNLIENNAWTEGALPSSGGEVLFSFKPAAAIQYIHLGLGDFEYLQVQVYDQNNRAVLGEEARIPPLEPQVQSKEAGKAARTGVVHSVDGSSYSVEVTGLDTKMSYSVRVRAEEGAFIGAGAQGTFEIAFAHSEEFSNPKTLPEITLTENLWAEDRLSAGETKRFRFTATAEIQYIQFMPGTLDVQVYDSDKTDKKQIMPIMSVFSDNEYWYSSYGLTPESVYFVHISIRSGASGDSTPYKILFTGTDPKLQPPETDPDPSDPDPSDPDPSDPDPSDPDPSDPDPSDPDPSDPDPSDPDPSDPDPSDPELGSSKESAILLAENRPEKYRLTDREMWFRFTATASKQYIYLTDMLTGGTLSVKAESENGSNITMTEPSTATSSDGVVCWYSSDFLFGNIYYVCILASTGTSFTLELTGTSKDSGGADTGSPTSGLYKGGERVQSITLTDTFDKAIANKIVQYIKDSPGDYTLEFDKPLKVLALLDDPLVHLELNSGSLLTIRHTDNGSNALFITGGNGSNVFGDLSIGKGITLQGKSAGNNSALVVINAGGAFTMHDGAKIIGNKNTGRGEYGGDEAPGSGSMYGGAILLNDGAFIMYGGEISGNTAEKGGGVYVGSTGTVILNGGTINGNTAADGGGVYIGGGHVELNGGDITGHWAYAGGGGVYVGSTGTVILNGGTINGNTATDGGGVYIACGGHVELNGGDIIRNTAECGGGVYIGDTNNGTTVGTLIIKKGRISENKTEPGGGGGGGITMMLGSSVIMQGGEISENMADTNDGGGVYVAGGVFIMSGGEISGNRAIHNDGYKGGGVYVDSGAFELNDGGTISGNTATDGGGVFVRVGEFTMSGGTISGNTADNNGGGVYVVEGGTFTKTGGIITGLEDDPSGGNVARGGEAVWDEFYGNTGGTLGINDNFPP